MQKQHGGKRAGSGRPAGEHGPKKPLTIASRNSPVANEFNTLPITAHDEDGNELATHTWDGWNKEVLKDTYGEKFEDVLESAAAKMR